MRPPILFPLFADIRTLPGVGLKMAPLLERAAGPHVVDMLWHLPTGLVDRRFSPLVAQAPEGVVVTLKLRILAHEPARTSRLPYRVHCEDESGPIDLVFFRVKGDYLTRQLPVGEICAVSGRVERYRDDAQMAHPDHMVPIARFDEIAIVEPVYGLTAGLSPKTVAKAAKAALANAPSLPEWADAHLVAKRGWFDWRAALARAHHSARAATRSPRPPKQDRPRRRARRAADPATDRGGASPERGQGARPFPRVGCQRRRRGEQEGVSEGDACHRARCVRPGGRCPL